MQQSGLRLLRIVVVLLATTAALNVAAAQSQAQSAAFWLTAAALMLTAALCWRLSHNIASSIDESQAWSRAAHLESTLANREGLWAALPAAAAAWDDGGNLLAASALWRSLALDIQHPPEVPEVVLGEPPRVFIVEKVTLPDGVQLALLREVTRERQALHAKDELLAIVGHELRTPLSSIKGYGQLMGRQLATIQEQVQRLDRLIADVLNAADAEAGLVNLKRAPVSVRDIIQSASDRFAAVYPDRKLDVNIHTEAFIEGDSERLGQVMDNLLSNAAKYSPADSLTRLESLVDDKWVRITVTDEGRGIPAEHLPRLFDRFYRVPVVDGPPPPGSGLGLSIVRDLVEAHGGQITVVSKGPGHGSTFRVSLPLTLALDAEETTRAGVRLGPERADDEHTT